MSIRFFRFNVVLQYIIAYAVACVVKVVGDGRYRNQLLFFRVTGYRFTRDDKVLIVVQYLFIVTRYGYVCRVFGTIPFMRTAGLYFQDDVPRCLGGNERGAILIRFT